MWLSLKANCEVPSSSQTHLTYVICQCSRKTDQREIRDGCQTTPLQQSVAYEKTIRASLEINRSFGRQGGIQSGVSKCQRFDQFVTQSASLSAHCQAEWWFRCTWSAVRMLFHGEVVHASGEPQFCNTLFISVTFTDVKQHNRRLVLGWVRHGRPSGERYMWSCVRSSVYTLICDRHLTRT